MQIEPLKVGIHNGYFVVKLSDETFKFKQYCLSELCTNIICPVMCTRASVNNLTKLHCCNSLLFLFGLLFKLTSFLQGVRPDAGNQPVSTVSRYVPGATCIQSVIVHLSPILIVNLFRCCLFSSFRLTVCKFHSTFKTIF